MSDQVKVVEIKPFVNELERVVVIQPNIDVLASSLPDVPPMKTCLRCQKPQLLSEYPVNELTNDGHDGICQRCLKWHDTVLKAQVNKKVRKARAKKGEVIDIVPVKDEVVEPIAEVVKDSEVIEDDFEPLDEIEEVVEEKEVKVRKGSGFAKNLGDESEQSVYIKQSTCTMEVGGVIGDLAGRAKLADKEDELFCVEWVAKGGDGEGAYRKSYGGQVGGKKLERTVEGIVKRYDIACRIRYLRDEKAVEECGYDIATGKGKWMEEVCKIATDSKLTARDRLKAMELISKATGHEKPKANGNGGTIIRVTTGVRGEPGKNQSGKKDDKDE